jgi:hypothetical protein
MNPTITRAHHRSHNETARIHTAVFVLRASVLHHFVLSFCQYALRIHRCCYTVLLG